eukprot:INCI11275.3.p1 GENE.INCI11275.3~~INCI11275.3.p1  ORF type:complete len:195 (+),score=26.71 INCI11275.3:258-842(+)
MWSCLLLLFLFFWSNDALPRFKRGSRSFSTLTLGVVAFVVMFTLVHQDDAYQNKEQKCPPALDLATWLGIDLANGAITLLVMFFVALRLGTPREHKLAAYMYANALDVSQTHGQHKMFTAKGELVPHDFSPKSAKYLVDHLDPLPSSVRLSSLRWVLLVVGVFDVILNCVGVWVLVEVCIPCFDMFCDLVHGFL